MHARSRWVGSPRWRCCLSLAGHAGRARRRRTDLGRRLHRGAGRSRQALFQTSCGRCHNNELVGSERAPALKGEWILLALGERHARQALHQDSRHDAGRRDRERPRRRQTRHPRLRPVDERGAGRSRGAESQAWRVLENIFVSKKGGAATPTVANFTLVQAVGCLARGPNQEWLLTKASEPATTRDETPSAANVDAAKAKQLGSLEFRLLERASALQRRRARWPQDGSARPGAAHRRGQPPEPDLTADARRPLRQLANQNSTVGPQGSSPSCRNRMRSSATRGRIVSSSRG